MLINSLMRMCEREIKAAMVSWKIESFRWRSEKGLPEVLRARNICDGRNPPGNPEKKELSLIVES